MAADPIHQFQIHKLFTIGHIGGQEIAFTNSSAYMFGTVAVISLLMIGGSAGRQLVPGRIQSIAELSYEFVASTIRSTAGTAGMKFFPLVFSLFMFICVSNLIGIIPYAFTVSSHLIVTAALALGRPLPHAVSRAKNYVTQAIARSYRLGNHSGLNHFGGMK